MSIFLMGAYDPATSRWCTVTKCGIGFDDKTLEQLQKDLKVVKISKVCPPGLEIWAIFVSFYGSSKI